MAYPTPLLDQIQAEKRQAQEQKRLATLAKTLAWLRINGHQYGIKQGYICGSLICPHRFTNRSDVDLAVEQINPEFFFLAMAQLSEHLEREVDIIQLTKCHFADRLRQQGIPWTTAN